MKLLALACGLTTLVAGVQPVAADEDEGRRRAIGRRMRLEIRDHDDLVVARGGLRARIADDVTVIEDVTVSGQRIVVEGMGCNLSRRFELSYAILEARLANAEGMRLHGKRRHTQAATMFARAAKLDPTDRKVAGNLASALALAGKVDAAAAALAAWRAADPIAAYVKVATDPELATLRERPEQVARRAANPGVADALTDDGVIGGAGALWSAETGLIAVIHEEQSWGANNGTRELELRDPARPQPVAVLPLVGWDDSDPSEEARSWILPSRRAAVTARVATARRVLVELGFRPPAQHEVGELGTAESNSPRARFARSRLGLVIADNGVARAMRKDDVLATATGAYHQLERAVYLPDERLIIAVTGRPGSEGCESSDPRVNVVLRLP